MGFEPENYQASTIVDEIMLTYDLGKIDPERVRDTLRQKVKAICESIKITEKVDLWEKSKIVNGKQTQHYFSQEERKMILDSHELYKYIHKLMNIEKTVASAYNKAKREAEKAQEAYEKMLSETDWEQLQYSSSEYTEIGVTEEDIKKKKFELMIEAIFSLYFTPIDEQKLRYDMAMSNVPSGADLTPEMAMARDRLNDWSYYCQPKQKK